MENLGRGQVPSPSRAGVAAQPRAPSRALAGSLKGRRGDELCLTLAQSVEKKKKKGKKCLFAGLAEMQTLQGPCHLQHVTSAQLGGLGIAR